jgi:hypothetical protein
VLSKTETDDTLISTLQQRMAALQQQQANTSPQLRVQRATGIGNSSGAHHSANNTAATTATNSSNATADTASYTVVSGSSGTATKKADAAMSHRLAKYMAAAEQEGWGQYNNNNSSERDKQYNSSTSEHDRQYHSSSERDNSSDNGYRGNSTSSNHHR